MKNLRKYLLSSAFALALVGAYATSSLAVTNQGAAVPNANPNDCVQAQTVELNVCDDALTDGIRCHVVLPGETVQKEAFIVGTECEQPLFRPE